MVSMQEFDFKCNLGDRNLSKQFSTQISDTLYLFLDYPKPSIIFNIQDQSASEIDIGQYFNEPSQCAYRKKLGVGILGNKVGQFLIYRFNKQNEVSVISRSLPRLDLKFLNFTKNNQKIRFFCRDYISIKEFDIKQEKFTQEFKPLVKRDYAPIYTYLPESDRYVEILRQDQYGSALFLAKIKFSKDKYIVKHIRQIQKYLAQIRYQISSSKSYKGMALLFSPGLIPFFGGMEIPKHSYLFDMKKSYFPKGFQEKDLSKHKLKPLCNNMMSTPIISISLGFQIIMRNTKNHEEYELWLGHYLKKSIYELSEYSYQPLHIDFEDDCFEEILNEDDQKSFQVGIKGTTYNISSENLLVKFSLAL